MNTGSNGNNRSRKQGDFQTLDLLYEKVAPQAPDMEESVLGAIMLEKQAFDVVVDILKPECFYMEAHQRIFSAMIKLSSKSMPVDILTVVQELRAAGELETVGGPFYVTKLTNSVVSSANIEAHSRIVLQKFMQRELIRISGEIITGAYQETADVFTLLDEAEKSLFEMTTGHLKSNYSSIAPLYVKNIRKIKELMRRGEDITGISSGYRSLDACTGGWQPTDLIIIAARPSVGKCLGKGTKVIMYDGTLKNVEDIMVGDVIMGDDSTPRNVLSLCKGKEMMYIVKQVRGIEYRVNENHILCLMSSRNECNRHHGDKKDMSLGEYIKKSNKFKNNWKGYKCSRIEFPEQKTLIPPYLLGIWLGDGSQHSPEITCPDIEIENYISEYAYESGFKFRKIYHLKKCQSYTITRNKPKDKPFKEYLRSLDLIGNKHIPYEFIYNSKENRLQLLAGLLDTDGYLIQSGGYEITQKRFRLIKDIKFLADSLGFRTVLKNKIGSIKSRGFSAEYFKLTIYGDIWNIPLKVKRKIFNKSTRSRDHLISGLTVIRDKVDDYYGFVIDGNNRFLLEDGTVTHNSSFALNLARNAALHPRYPVAVGIFSLEMSSDQITQRLIAMESDYFLDRIRRGKFEDSSFLDLDRKCRDTIARAPIFIDETPAINIFELRAKARRMVTKDRVKLIIVDYLQLMSGVDDRRNSNREQEISKISRDLKGLAKELKVPVIALSQMSREVEKRKGGEPMLSDLRECLPVNEWVYTPEGPVQLKEKPKNVVSLFIGKTGIYSCNFISKKYNSVYLVRSQFGSFRATAKHFVLTGTGWKQVCKLNPDRDVIASPKRIPHDNKGGKPHARLLGWLIGNGGLKGTPSLIYRKELDDEVKKEVGKFGVKVNYRRHQKSKNVYDTYLSNGKKSGSLSNPLMEWIRSIGIEGQDCYDKRIPELYMGSSDQTHKELLIGLWETDGTVTGGMAKYSTVSEVLARQVSWLLHTIGVRSTVGFYNKIWEVRCSVSDNDNMKSIVSNVVRFGKLSAPDPDYIDPAPSIFVEMINEIASFKAIRIQKKESGGFKSMSKERMKQILNDWPISTINDSPYMIYDNIGWGRLYSVEKIKGEVRVCDLSVPCANNFVTNGIVVHNSGAIEQDADLVGFLSRPDYQKQEGEIDPWIAGDAELKIAKHRNGSLERIPFKANHKTQRWQDANQFDGAFPAAAPVPSYSPAIRNYTEPTKTEIEDDLPF